MIIKAQRYLFGIGDRYKPYMIVFLVILLWIALHLILRPRPAEQPFVTSHRGAAGLAPENTLAGIREALKHNPDYCEIDVQRSSDGVLVVMHNPTVDQTTDGKGEVARLTWSEIGRLDAGSTFAPEFAGERVPSFESVLGLFVDQPTVLLIEAKDPGKFPGIERQIADTLKRFDMSDKVLVASFDHQWLRRFHALSPDTPLIQIAVWSPVIKPIPMTSIVANHWLSFLIDPTLVERAHRQGYKVQAWTVDSVWQMKLLLWLGVDGITTNRPDLWTPIPSSL